MSIAAILSEYTADQLMLVIARVSGWSQETLVVELRYRWPMDHGFPGRLAPEMPRFFASTRICGETFVVTGSGRGVAFDDLIVDDPLGDNP